MVWPMGVASGNPSYYNSTQFLSSVRVRQLLVLCLHGYLERRTVLSMMVLTSKLQPFMLWMVIGSVSSWALSLLWVAWLTLTLVSALLWIFWLVSFQQPECVHLLLSKYSSSVSSRAKAEHDISLCCPYPHKFACLVTVKFPEWEHKSYPSQVV